MNESDTAPDDYAVETAGLTKRFGGRTAVDRVDLRVPAGTAFGYLGPNGAGKTTLIRMLLGLTRPTAGSMRLLGYRVPQQRSAALRRVGAMAEEPRFLDHLTGRENPRVNAAARDLAAAVGSALLAASNAFTPGSSWDYATRPRPSGGTHIELVVNRCGRTVKGRLLAMLLRVSGRRLFCRDLAETLHRLEQADQARAAGVPDSSGHERKDNDD